MNTSKPISTVSFNTEGFLKETLDKLVVSDKLEFWAYVKHLPEPKEDDGNGKEHFHVYVVPAKRIQTTGLQSYFNEFEAGKKIPRKTMPFLTSKFPDWYLYSLHDKDYLRFKGLTKKFHYKPSDVKTSDVDFLNYLVRQIQLTDVSVVASMAQYIGLGMTFNEYFMSGHVPVQQMKQFNTAWELVGQELRKDFLGHAEDKASDTPSPEDDSGNVETETSDKPDETDGKPDETAPSESAGDNSGHQLSWFS